MLFEIFGVLWLGVLAIAVYFFAKSLSEAITKGRQARMVNSVTRSKHYTIPAHHLSPTGHRGRRPVH